MSAIHSVSSFASRAYSGSSPYSKSTIKTLKSIFDYSVATQLLNSIDDTKKHRKPSIVNINITNNTVNVYVGGNKSAPHESDASSEVTDSGRVASDTSTSNLSVSVFV